MKQWLSRAVALIAIIAAARHAGASRGSGDSVAGALVRFIVNHPWLTAMAAGGVATATGLLVAVSGVMPIKASSGHWAITAAFLDFAKVRSVATHSLFVQPPPALDDPALVLRGAGHYESGCRPCHGGPGTAVPPVMAAMTPPPPALSGRISRWKPEALFSIVKHGIKFTGMPAWPTMLRDDEVWAMVAFLRRMPALDATAYRTLVYGDSGGEPDSVKGIRAAGAPAAVRDVCGRCHGVDGAGRGSAAFPKLAGQSAAYLLSALKGFARGERHSGIMQPIAAGLDETVMQDLALYYSGLGTSQPASTSPSGAAVDSAPGAAIAQQGIPAQRVPACADCHLPGATERNAAYPGLTGQYSDYLVAQLGLFNRRERGGSAYAHLMPPIAGALTAEQMQAVAQYFASLSGPLRSR
jgi:cytochrome c553